jgi:hypothetical protein
MYTNVSALPAETFVRPCAHYSTIEYEQEKKTSRPLLLLFLFLITRMSPLLMYSRADATAILPASIALHTRKLSCASWISLSSRLRSLSVSSCHNVEQRRMATHTQERCRLSQLDRVLEVYPAILVLDRV